jgi:hypothetical protein
MPKKEKIPPRSISDLPKPGQFVLDMKARMEGTQIVESVHV